MINYQIIKKQNKLVLCQVLGRNGFKHSSSGRKSCRHGWIQGFPSCLFHLFLSLVFPEMSLFSSGFTPQREGSWDSLTSQGPVERARLFFHYPESPLRVGLSRCIAVCLLAIPVFRVPLSAVDQVRTEGSEISALYEKGMM